MNYKKKNYFFVEIFLKLIEWIELCRSQATFKYPNPWLSSANHAAVSSTTSGATQSYWGQNSFQNSSFVDESSTCSAQHLWSDILNVFYVCVQPLDSNVQIYSLRKIFEGVISISIGQLQFNMVTKICCCCFRWSHSIQHICPIICLLFESCYGNGTRFCMNLQPEKKIWKRIMILFIRITYPHPLVFTPEIQLVTQFTYSTILARSK